MQPLQYKYIGNEEHLTFDSIRRSVFSELSSTDNKEARQHIIDCYRCRSIHESLATPEEVRKSFDTGNIESKLFYAILLVLVSMGLAISFVYFGDSLNISSEKLSNFYSWTLLKVEDEEIPRLMPNPPAIESSYTFESKRNTATSGLKTIDPIAGISAKPDNKHFDTYVGTENQLKLKGIHGKITANGVPLQGVTVMVPEGRTAKVSNSNGNYDLQIPENTNVLQFIYQGKQLVQTLNSTSDRLDIDLKIESMSYPKIDTTATSNENTAGY